VSVNGQSIPYHIEVDDNVGLDHVNWKQLDGQHAFFGFQLSTPCNLSGKWLAKAQRIRTSFHRLGPNYEILLNICIKLIPKA
jgi:hypothetical protein